MIKKILLVFVTFMSLHCYPKEGMWVPIFLQGVIMEDMKLNGLKLTAEDIYSVNHSSLKDAVVRFGGGCTAEFISSSGLLLTNHHCGYGNIQSHSSLEHDYLTDGFWAKNNEEELQNPGLTASVVLRIEDVTEAILSGTSENMPAAKADSIMKINTQRLVSENSNGKEYEAFVKSFSNGNQFILFVTQTFRDVRLVGAPPSSIGKFGFDTDNWVWPRHTGDFSIFRVYAGKDNKPAEYSKDNVPYKPAYHFKISMKGYQEGDFAMVYGYPYKTEEYLTSDAVEFILNVSNPVKIDIRERKLKVLNEKMLADDGVRIKYAAKQSSASNAWKKWKGQERGLEKNHTLEHKREFEITMEQRILLYPEKYAQYNGLLEKLAGTNKEINEVSLARDYYAEIIYYGVDALSLAAALTDYVSKNAKGEIKKEDEEKLMKLKSGFYKNYDQLTDFEVFKAIFPLYMNSTDNFYKAAYLRTNQKKFNLDSESWMSDIYMKSILTDEKKFNELLSKDISKALKTIEKDRLFVMTREISEFYRNQISPAYNTLSAELESLNKKYIQAIRDVFPDNLYYADANGTLRLSYGKIEGMLPSDAVTYLYYTTLEGVVAKYDPASYEFDLPEKLIELHNNKDYGPYAKDGEMRVCFLSSNHTSGGNSGSPVINGQGELIGLNFDRNWEGTMSDIDYDISQCRNIAVDIRYVLFIIDKFAGAHHLIEELSLIN